MDVFTGAAFFAGAACAGVIAAGRLTLQSFPDGPRPAQPPRAALVAGAAIVGGAVAHAHAGVNLPLSGMVIFALAAVWCTDVRSGIVPDVFTLIPLGIIACVALFEARTWTIASAALLAMPFGVAAAFSRGIGMGWGDVKLAALGGAVLGAQTAFVAFILASVVAVLHAYAGGRAREPMALAPYLAASIAVAMPLGGGPFV